MRVREGGGLHSSRGLLTVGEQVVGGSETEFLVCLAALTANVSCRLMQEVGREGSLVGS